MLHALSFPDPGPRHQRRLRLAGLVSGVLLALTAWAPNAAAQGVDPAEGRKLFTQPAGKAPKKGDKGPEAKAAWTILLEAFRGEDVEARARDTLARIQREGQLADAYLERRGDTWVLAYGRYASLDDPAARADLERVKAIRVGESLPFAGAKLTPPLLAGTIPEYDLRNAKRQLGDEAKYTLQIGVYGREDKKTLSPADLAEIRKAAEEAAVKLRREGEQAFYYHGPYRSTVTIGVFSDDDYDASAPEFQSARLKQARERYPYNLLNGKGVRRKVTMTTPQGQKTRVERIDPSMLVLVPKGE